MPYSSASMSANTTHLAMAKNSSSPRRTLGPSGSLLISSGRMTWSSGFGFLVAHRGQARGVGGVGLAAAGEVGLVRGFLGVEHHRLHAQARALE
jgi:hypothetical protein